MRLTVGIDASRNRSGGAKVHLVGILGAVDPAEFGIGTVHVWSYDLLLDALPDAPWLVKHSPPVLRKSLAHQIWWQRRHLPREARAHDIDIMLSPDAGTVGRFHPSVVMSRDMLSYEPGEMRRYRFSRMWLRLWALRHVQMSSMRNAEGVIFLTRYAARVIQQTMGAVPRVAIIPHGVSSDFRKSRTVRPWPADGSRPIRCLYVSQVDYYKHQGMVVRAVAELRRRGYNLTLVLAGDSKGQPGRVLDEELRRADPARAFVEMPGFVSPSDLPRVLGDSDIFVFASSCENMPNTLVEAMASGLPIACSSRGPMPEVLRDGGVYFDPENVDSIVSAVQQLLESADLRNEKGQRASDLSQAYSWRACASSTWSFLRETYELALRKPVPPATFGLAAEPQNVPTQRAMKRSFPAI